MLAHRNILIASISLLITLTGCDQQVSDFIGSSRRSRDTGSTSNFQISESVQVVENETAVVSFRSINLKSESEFSYEIVPATAIAGTNYDVSSGSQGNFTLTASAAEKTISIPTLDQALKEGQTKEFKVLWKSKTSGKPDELVGTTKVIIQPRSDIFALNLINKGFQLPTSLYDGGTYILYAYDDGVNGTELWRSDGTAPGTFLVKDICAGSCGSDPRDFVEISGVIYFAAASDSTAYEVWKTDGTTAGTSLVFTAAALNAAWGGTNSADEQLVMTGTDSVTGNFQYLYKFGSKLVLATSNLLNSPTESLIVTDGTVGGTVRILNISTSSAKFMVLTNGANLYIHSTELWVSNGTAAGTTRVTSGIGFGGFLPSPLVPFGSDVYAIFGTATPYLTRTDGTVGGTSRYTTTRADWYNSAQIKPIGGKIYFTYTIGASPNTLLHVAPTTGTTSTQLLSLPLGTKISIVGAAGNNAVIWTSDGSTGAHSIYVSDGTPGGTVKVLDFPVLGAMHFRNYSDVFSFNNNLLFAVDGEYWVSDGTAAGTTLASVFFSPLGLTNIYPVKVRSGHLYFWADHATYGRELWKTDLTGINTTLVWDSNPGAANSEMNFIGEVMNSFWFSKAGTAATTTEVYKLDLTSGISTSVSVLFPYRSGFYYSNYLFTATFGISVGSSGYFVATQSGGPDKNTVFKLNPATFTLQILGDLGFAPVNAKQSGSFIFYSNTYCSSGCPYANSKIGIVNTQTNTLTTMNVAMQTYNWQMAKTGTKHIFKGFAPATGLEPWVTDGTVGGTSILLDITAGSGSTNFVLGEVGSLALIGTATALYATNGSVGATTAINPAAFTSGPTVFTKFGNKTVFAATTAAAGRELWITDGTLAGTSMIKDIGPTTASGISVSDVVYEVGSIFMFFADDGTNGTELWISDGTSAGTQMVKDIYSGATGSVSIGAKIMVLGNKLIFEATEAVSGREWWVSDGTLAGTQLLADLCSGVCTSSFQYPLVWNSKMYFWQVITGESKILTVTDGTPAGTQVVYSFGAATMQNTSFSGAFFMASSRYLYFPIRNAGDAVGRLWRSDGTTTELVPGNTDFHSPELPYALGSRFVVVQKKRNANHITILK